MPHHHRAWLAYGDALVDLQQYDDARIAFERARLTDPERRASSKRPRRSSPTIAGKPRRSSGRSCSADPSHVAALVGLAALSLAADKPCDAERLLRHALKQSRARTARVWRGLGPTLIALGRVQEAEAAARRLLRIEPENPQSWVTQAAVATRLLQQERALEAYEQAAALQAGEEVGLRMSIGHAQKTLGRRADSEASYKAGAGDRIRAMARPTGASRTSRTTSSATREIAAMQASAAAGDTARRCNEAQLHFALGKAFEQRGSNTRAPSSTTRAATPCGASMSPSTSRPSSAAARVSGPSSIAKFFAAHAGGGNPSRAPIFIVGLPRSGSTLIEQILASHSRVEGTMELPNIITFVHRVR